MTREEQRVYLIGELLAEFPRYKSMKIPKGAREQRKLLRSLMDIRPLRPIGEEFLIKGGRDCKRGQQPFKGMLCVLPLLCG